METKILELFEEKLPLIFPDITNPKIPVSLSNFVRDSALDRVDRERVKDFRGIDLIARDLEGIDLSGAGLSGANLAHCNLRGANLERCDLRFVNFQGADLSGASLRGANCEGALFLGTNWRNANLEGTNLRNATIEAVKCKRTNLTRASLTSPERSGRERVIKIGHPCSIPRGEYDLDGLLNEREAQYERARKAVGLFLLCLFFGFLKYLSFRFSM